jgi:hypothetical protein
MINQISTIAINFSIQISLHEGWSRLMPVKHITEEHIQYINDSVKINSILDYKDDIISEKLGIINLIECSIKVNDFMMDIDMIVETEKNSFDMEHEEIIRCVFPSIYCNNDSHKFIIYINCKSLLKFHSEPNVSSIMYLLNSLTLTEMKKIIKASRR